MGEYTRYASHPRRKIRRIFANAKSFAVVSGDEATEETLLAKEASLKRSETPGCRFIHTQKGKKGFAEKWLSILPAESGAPATFSTSILIPKNKIETKEISYTEDERYVSINISAAKEEISKENVIFKTLPAKLTPFLISRLPAKIS